MIKLEPYQLGHSAALNRLELGSEQTEFTALPSELLPRLEDDPKRQPIAITENDVAVGLFVLSVGPQRDEYLLEPDPDAVALSALSIDSGVQGRGIGLQAMKLLPNFMRQPYLVQRFPTAQRIILAVNQRNGSARRLYDRAGFEVVAERSRPTGPQWVMALTL